MPLLSSTFNASLGNRRFVTSKYAHLDKDALIRLLDRRDAEQPLGLVWERPAEAGGELDAEAVRNRDFVALELDESLSHGAAPWQHLIIEGDNFDALRALRVSHKGAIRCIYIDPPYNTGNRDFVYNDRFVDKTHRFRHSLWLEFMHARLELAKELLAEDGVIFVSIDDNELFRLGMLMDRVFGENQLVGVCTWERKRKGSHLSKKLTRKTEYVLIAAGRGKNVELFGEAAGIDEDQPLIKKTNDLKQLTFPPGTIKAKIADGIYPAGIYGTGASSARLLGDAVLENGIIQNSLSVEARFVWTQGNLDNEIAAGATLLVKSKKFSFRALKGKQNQGFKALSSLLLKDVVGTNESASAELAEIMNVSVEDIPIDYPKPSTLIEHLVRSATNDNRNSIILDFFAGSGTTAHAVAKLNAEDGGTRKFILVSSTEATEDSTDKNLCRDVCAERVRRVLGGYTNAKGQHVDGLGGGFAYLRTRRIPRHRLNRRLGHVEAWHTLQLMHGLPLDVWRGCGLASAMQVETAIAYLPEIDEAALAQLGTWLGDWHGPRPTVYSWAPERLHAFAGRIDALPIPQTLADRFGR